MMQDYAGNQRYGTNQYTYDPGDTVRDHRGADINFGGGNPHRGDLPAGNLDMRNLTRW
jgi:hypothetical protein